MKKTLLTIAIVFALTGMAIAAEVAIVVDPWTVEGVEVDSETTVNLSVNGGPLTVMAVLPAGTLTGTVSANHGDILEGSTSTIIDGTPADCPIAPFTVVGEIGGGCATLSN